jgi:repressor LexA
MEVLHGHDKPLKETVSIPVLGRVAAGAPLLALENYEYMFPLPTDFVGHGEFFMLSVKGDSMIEAGILEGDLVLVRCQPCVENGDIAVALIGEEATIKRFFKENDHIRLQPENHRLSPILAKEVQILGKVIGLVRKF